MGQARLYFSIQGFFWSDRSLLVVTSFITHHKINPSGSDAGAISALLHRHFQRLLQEIAFIFPSPREDSVRTSCRMMNYFLPVSSAPGAGNAKSCLSPVGRCAWQGDRKQIHQETGRLVWVLVTGSGEAAEFTSISCMSGCFCHQVRADADL